MVCNPSTRQIHPFGGQHPFPPPRRRRTADSVSRKRWLYPSSVGGIGTATCGGCPRVVKKTLVTLDVINVMRYYSLVIVSFKCRDTKSLAGGRRVRRFTAFERVTRRKLRQLEIAGDLNDLRVPPGNRLETLRGDREGQHSIRINNQFRICFQWTNSGPAEVEIVDYH